MDSTQYLSRAERIQQIGELLAKGATLMLIREVEAKRTQVANPQPMEHSAQIAGPPNNQTKSLHDHVFPPVDAQSGPSGPRFADGKPA